MIDQKSNSALAEGKSKKDDLEKYKDFIIHIEQKERLPDGTYKSVFKEYVTVAGRLKMFWDDNTAQGKQGSISTQKTLENEKEVEFTAVVTGARGTATGTARELKIEGTNAKSVIENCETSAVGRALGNLGYGLLPGTCIAPAEELKDREPLFFATPAQCNFIKDLIEKEYYDAERNKEYVLNFLKENKVESIEKLTIEQADALIKKLDKSKRWYGFAK